MVKTFSIFGLEGLPLVKEGDDLASLIVSVAKDNEVEIEDGDIIVVAQKIISKAEGRIVDLTSVEPSKKAVELAAATGKPEGILELVLRDSKRILKVSPQVVIVEDNRGLININAGLDKSNVRGESCFALLPEDPDRSASNLAQGLKALTGKTVGVVISDTYSRAFRRGQVNFAIGLYGVKPFVDYRGGEDLFGYVLKVKFSAIADEIAAAAELVMGQGNEATPVAIVKGLAGAYSGDAVSIKDLMISEEEDLFRNVWQRPSRES